MRRLNLSLPLCSWYDLGTHHLDSLSRQLFPECLDLETVFLTKIMLRPPLYLSPAFGILVCYLRTYLP